MRKGDFAGIRCEFLPKPKVRAQNELDVHCWSKDSTMYAILGMLNKWPLIFLERLQWDKPTMICRSPLLGMWLVSLNRSTLLWLKEPNDKYLMHEELGHFVLERLNRFEMSWKKEISDMAPVFWRDNASQARMFKILVLWLLGNVDEEANLFLFSVVVTGKVGFHKKELIIVEDG